MLAERCKLSRYGEQSSTRSMCHSYSHCLIFVYHLLTKNSINFKKFSLFFIFMTLAPLKISAENFQLYKTSQRPARLRLKAKNSQFQHNLGQTAPLLTPVKLFGFYNCCFHTKLGCANCNKVAMRISLENK